MALALLAAVSAGGPSPRFRFELGTNRYWSFAIGKETVRRGDGVQIIAEPAYTSPLHGPVAEHLLGRGEFEVNPQHFDRAHRLIQLYSYRTPALEGPAVSDVTRVLPGAAGDDLPAPALSESLTMTAPYATHTASHPAPFRYREAPVSNAMFLGALGGVLQSILPAVSAILPGLLRGRTGEAGGSARGGDPPIAELLRRASDPDTLRRLVELLRQVETALAGSTPAPAATAPAAAGSLAVRAMTMTRVRARTSGRPVGQLPRCRDRYSQAQVAPALLAALPALAPLLQQVLNPQTIQTVVDAPNRATQTVLNGLLDLGKLGLKEQQQLNEHLERLNPGVDDPALEQLLASLSLGFATAGTGDYARTASVRIDFEHAPAVTLAGQERLVYLAGGPLAFPLMVETPRTIPQGTLQLEIKEAETLAVRFRRTWPVEQVAAGPLLTIPGLSAAEGDRLMPNRRYLVCASLTWDSRKGRRLGTSRHMEIQLIGPYTFDRVDEAEGLSPMDDVDRFRDYWHKVWEHTLERGATRVTLDAKYYYVLKPGRHANARLETQVRRGGDQRNVRLRSGMDLSPTALNRLLPLIAPDAAPLSEAELEALQAPEFVERLSLSARHTADFRGRSEARVALWVYPEFRLDRIVLQQAADTNEHGQVLALGEHEVRFPSPALVHFIGTRSQ